MHYGFRIVEDMIDGLNNWMDEKGFATHRRFSRAERCPRSPTGSTSNLNYKIVARIHPEKCIGCDLCYIACWDGAHQCIHMDVLRQPAGGGSCQPRPHRSNADSQAGPWRRISETPPHVFRAWMKHECVGCNLCWLVCPVEDCITMERVENRSASPDLGGFTDRADGTSHSERHGGHGRQDFAADVLIEGEHIKEVRAAFRPNRGTRCSTPRACC